MNDRILVAYATRAGSTAEVAQTIAKPLSAADLTEEVRQVLESASR